MVPSHESEALQDKQKLQMETFSELSECLFSTAFTCKNDFLRTSFYIQLSGMSSTFLFFFLMFTRVTGEPVTGGVSEMVKQAARVKQSKELLAGKDRKMEETRQELEKIKSENDEKAAAFLKELQAARTELSEVKEGAQKKQEEIKALKGQLDAQRSNNACLHANTA